MGAKSIFIHFLICKLKKNVCCEKKRGMGGKFDKGLLMFGLFNHTHASLFTCNIHVAYISIVMVHNQTITIIAEFFFSLPRGRYTHVRYGPVLELPVHTVRLG